MDNKLKKSASKKIASSTSRPAKKVVVTKEAFNNYKIPAKGPLAKGK